MIKSLNKLVYSDDGNINNGWAYRLEADKMYLLPRVVRSFEVWATVKTESKVSLQVLVATVHGDILTIHAGFCWDGLTWWPDTASNMCGGLPHDFGYQLGSCPESPFSRAEIDGWLRDLILPRSPKEAKLTWAGVRSMGWNFYGKKSNIRIKLL